jgi:hypothetical protein
MPQEFRDMHDVDLVRQQMGGDRMPKVEGEMSGKRYGYNRQSGEDAILQVRELLAKYLRSNQ